jgi:hypothetical protein
MPSLKRHQTFSLFLGIALSAFVGIFMWYDSRSPLKQWVTAYGTVAIDRWSATDLDSVCIRLEPGRGTPLVWGEAVTGVATNALPGSHVRQVLLVTYRDACASTDAQLAWAVVVEWTLDPAAVNQAGGPQRRPRGIAIVDAASGSLITSKFGG